MSKPRPLTLLLFPVLLALLTSTALADPGSHSGGGLDRNGAPLFTPAATGP